jgi:hypothetical protein
MPCKQSDLLSIVVERFLEMGASDLLVSARPIIYARISFVDISRLMN